MHSNLTGMLFCVENHLLFSLQEKILQRNLSYYFQKI